MHVFSKFQKGEMEKKYAGLLEKKWTSVIRLQKKVFLKKLIACMSFHMLLLVFFERMVFHISFHSLSYI